MGVVTGRSKKKFPEENLAYSEDPDVVAGEQRSGCGWCPATEFERVAPGADILAHRRMNDREDAHHRDLYAKYGEAASNLFVVKACLVTATVKGKVIKKGLKLVEYISGMAAENPSALDLLADRIVHCTRGKDPASLYSEHRLRLGVAEPEKDDDDASKEGAPDEGAPKSDVLD